MEQKLLGHVEFRKVSQVLGVEVVAGKTARLDIKQGFDIRCGYTGNC